MLDDNPWVGLELPVRLSLGFPLGGSEGDLVCDLEGLLDGEILRSGIDEYY